MIQETGSTTQRKELKGISKVTVKEEPQMAGRTTPPPQMRPGQKHQERPLQEDYLDRVPKFKHGSEHLEE